MMKHQTRVGVTEATFINFSTSDISDYAKVHVISWLPPFFEMKFYDFSMTYQGQNYILQALSNR